MIMNDYYGADIKWFIGIVKESSSFGVKVRIFGKHRMDDVVDISDGDLPQALIVYPTTTGRTQHSLREGDWVFGIFTDSENCQTPIIIGSFGNSVPETGTTSFSAVLPNSLARQNQEEGAIQDDAINSNVQPGQRAQVAYDFFYRKLTEANAGSGNLLKTRVSAIIGNLMTESGPNLNPDARNPTSSAYGIAQWTYSGDRRGMLERFPESTPRGASQPFAKQLQFVWHEFQTTESRSYRQLISSSTLSDCVAAMVAYERDESWQRLPGTNSFGVNRTHSVFLKKLRDSQTVYNTMSPTQGS